MADVKIGDRVRLFGGYDMEPKWLNGKRSIEGVVLKWIQGQNANPACVVNLDEELTATGDVHGRSRTVTGRYVVLESRYAGQSWRERGTVHVELCDSEPPDLRWQQRDAGAWVESHASYEVISPG